MYRRRSRIGSTTLGLESRWTPSVSVIVLIVGILLGLVVNLPGALNARSATLDDDYLVLSATLYRHGENVAALRDGLRNIGFADPLVSISQLASQYAESRDGDVRSQANLLQSFVEAMERAPAAAAPALDQSGAPSAVLQGDRQLQQSAQSSVVVAPIVIGTPIAHLITTPMAAVIIIPELLIPKSGKVLTAARLRKEPNTDSEHLGLLPEGATVQIKNIVDGEAVVPVEPRWYHVTFDGIEGFVYYSLIAAGE